MANKTLVLLRHGESDWNRKNLFTGWTDVDLSEVGVEEAKEAGQLLKAEKIEFDICFTSYLKRAIHTLNYTLDSMDRAYLPVVKAWELNERHYGTLQGLNKSETTAKYGAKQVQLWRRSYDVPPPALEKDDSRNPALQFPYKKISKDLLPLTECLKDTVARVIPYFEEQIKPHLDKNEKVLIAAHGNSLRALVMYLEHISPEEIAQLNIPTGIPLVYELDEDYKVIKRHYLGDPALVEAKINQVANQAHAHK